MSKLSTTPTLYVLINIKFWLLCLVVLIEVIGVVSLTFVEVVSLIVVEVVVSMSALLVVSMYIVMVVLASMIAF